LLVDSGLINNNTDKNPKTIHPKHFYRRSKTMQLETKGTEEKQRVLREAMAKE